MQEWRVYSKKADFDRLSARFGIDPVVARIIRNRNLTEDSQFEMYLNGTAADMYDPNLMKDMGAAVSILSDAVREGNRIRIIGDYDIDGICSIYILFMGLKKLGADVDFDIPDRITDGYGINSRMIDDAYNAGVKLILTCDNGIAAYDEIEYAEGLGLKVIVTDHHDIPFEESDGAKKYRIPNAHAVVNPKQEDCPYPFDRLCGAGIAYKYMQAMGVSDEDMLCFAAIATVGDIVDLVDENRIIVKEGLKCIAHTDNKGLLAIISECGLDKSSISSFHIGFVIGPCMNASGRLDTAKKALRMFLTEDDKEAGRIAVELIELNDIRKKLTAKAVEQAEELIENSDLKDDRVLVVYIKDCHESIAGIVAGRIREKYYRPTIVLCDGEDGIKGSARSIEGYNMFLGLCGCREYLTRFGGHPMAAGLSLPADNYQPFRKSINEQCTLTDSDMVEKIWIDVPMPIEYVNEKLIDELKLLEPFGKANEKPVFADKNLIISRVRAMGKEGQYTSLELTKNSGARIRAVGFFPPEELTEAFFANKRVSCTYYPQINTFRGENYLQICVTGYKIENI